MTHGFDRNSWVNAYCVQLKPLTDVEEPFHIREVKDILPDDRSPQQWMLQLKTNGIINQVNKIWLDNDPVHEYEFNPVAREFIQERAEDMSKLPCGCVAHIPDMRDAPEGKGPCKHCGAIHSKETFKNSL